MNLISSNNPITISQNGQDKVYDKWLIERASVNIGKDGKVSLIVFFHRCTEAGEAFPGEASIFSIEDILTDSDTAQASGAFFSALVAKAMQTGVIL